MFTILQNIFHFFQSWWNTNHHVMEPFELVPFCTDGSDDSDTETVVCQDMSCMSDVDYLTD